ncbi:MAG: ATP-grasp domain-containing protein [Acidimicrobiia bacterium]|nr:MAG: ATP-grasp domain-containing protein [Acidimicrobiia bacterium]
MRDVRLVTCAALPAPDPDTPRLAAALTARGASVEVADWRDGSVDWAGARVTLLRSPWDYADDLDAFLTWAEGVAGVSALWNPLGLVRWNTHKAYLLELDSAGAPVVPTVMLTRGSAVELAGVADAQGWNALVVKPAVGYGANGVGRFDVGDPAAQRHVDALLERGDVLVQPYARTIEQEGELSLVLVDGRATHAVRKLPAPGDYRIHERYGGTFAPVAASDGLVELGERVCGVLPEAPLYARVDVLRGDGRWQVLEVEVTEPRLFLDLAPPAATDSLVDAVMARLA